MRENEFLRRRVDALLKATEALPGLESFPSMLPAERAAAMSTAWDLRHRWESLAQDLESESQYRDRDWTEVAAAARELADRARRYDRCAVDLVALCRHSVGDCVEALRKAELARLERAGAQPGEPGFDAR